VFPAKTTAFTSAMLDVTTPRKKSAIAFAKVSSMEEVIRLQGCTLLVSLCNYHTSVQTVIVSGLIRHLFLRGEVT